MNAMENEKCQVFFSVGVHAAQWTKCTQRVRVHWLCCANKQSEEKPVEGEETNRGR